MLFLLQRFQKTEQVKLSDCLLLRYYSSGLLKSLKDRRTASYRLFSVQNQQYLHLAAACPMLEPVAAEVLN